MTLPIRILPALICAAFFVPTSPAVAQEGDTERAASAVQSSNADLQALKEQNALVEEQIKLLTNRQNLVKMYFPAIPEGLAGTLERKGDLSIESTAAAYDSLVTIARAIADRIEGKTVITNPAMLCPGLAGRDLKKCVNDAQKKINDERGSCPAPLDSPKYERVLLHGDREVGAVLSLYAFQAQLDLLVMRLKEILKPQPEPAREGISAMAIAPILAIGPALKAVYDIASLFKRNVVITTAEVQTDESALAAAVAAELRCRNIAKAVLYSPSLLSG